MSFIVFNSNIHNLCRAINERLFYRKVNGKWVRPHEADELSVARLELVVARDLYKHLPRTVPMSQEDFLSGYGGRKLTVYTEAVKSINRSPLTAKDAELRAFIKIEKLSVAKEIPRVIQTRDPRYHVELGRYTRKVEKNIYHAVDEMCRLNGGGLVGEKTILKGMNCVDQAKQILMKFNRFDKPVIYQADAKRFDQSVTALISHLEHSVYVQCFNNPKHKRRLQSLLDMQLVNRGKGYCRDGKVDYLLGPSRCSGDMNTGLGNCLLMSIMMYGFLYDHLGLRKFAISDNGDDVFIIVEDKHAKLVGDTMYSYFNNLGFIMEIEDPVYEIEKIKFCQTSPVFDGEKWRMVRDVNAALTKDAISIKPFQSQMELANYLHSVGEGGLSLAGGIPVVQEYYQSMIRNSELNNPNNKQFKDILTERDGFYWQRRGMHEKYRPITDAARVSFYEAFGILPEVQVEMEIYYRNLVIPWQGASNLTHGAQTIFHY